MKFEVRELLYTGKAKELYATSEPEVLLVRYRDQATALDGLKKEEFAGKGELNNRIAAEFFQLLKERGIESHFIRQVGPREMLVRKVAIIPVEVVARNLAAGSVAKRLGLAEGVPFSRPVLEFFLKDDAHHDPWVNHHHIRALGLATEEQMAAMEAAALQVNKILWDVLKEKGIILVDLKLEFGLYRGQVLLADEISPDTCRFWDAETGEKLDKDRFRRDLGGLLEAYREILRRIKGEHGHVES